MKNKENALKKIEQIEGMIKNVKTSSYRGNAQEMNDYFKNLEELVDELRGIISIENEEFLNRAYRGL
jgi:superfamily I DNA/RNA helicase